MNLRLLFLVLLSISLSFGQLCSVLGADQYLISSIAGQTRSRDLVLTNSSPNQINITSYQITGANSSFYTMTPPATPTTVAPMGTLTIPITFAPPTIGVKPAELVIMFDNGLNATVLLRGLGFKGYGGDNEPSLQYIFDAFQFPIYVQDDDPSNNMINSNESYWIAERLGDELPNDDLFQAADPSLPIQLTVIATWGPQPQDGSPVVNWGWYVPGNSAQSTKIFSVANTDSQTLWPTTTGNLNFSVTPADSTFAVYSDWPYFGTRKVCSEDAQNTWDNGYHHIRVYRYKDRMGNAINNTLVITTEEYTADKDFNDLIIVASNMKLASDPAGFGMGVQSPSTDVYCWPTVIVPSSSVSSSSPSSSSTSSASDTSSASLTDSTSQGQSSGTATSDSVSSSASSSESPTSSQTSASTSSSESFSNPRGSSSASSNSQSNVGTQDVSSASSAVVSILLVACFIFLNM